VVKDTATLDLLISHGANVEDLIPLMFGKDARLDGRQKALTTAVVTGSAQGINAAAPSLEEINKQLPDGSTLLQLATMLGRIDAMNWLLDHGANVNASNADGITALHVAIIAMTPEASQKVAMMQSLLKRGATIDALDKGGRTPLHFAAATYNKDAVDCLLRNGADPLRRTKDGLTPIQVAQRSEHGTGLFGIATQVDETEKSATIDALRTSVRARPVQ
jgi:ankyrin repeat protein